MTTTIDLLSAPDGPYEFATDLPPGSVLKGIPPYPELVVESAQALEVKALVVHRLTVRTDEGERYDVLRLVAIAEGPDGDLEVEVGERQVMPTAMFRDAVPGKCPSCGLPMLNGEADLCGECAGFNAGYAGGEGQ